MYVNKNVTFSVRLEDNKSGTKISFLPNVKIFHERRIILALGFYIFFILFLPYDIRK